MTLTEAIATRVFLMLLIVSTIKGTVKGCLSRQPFPVILQVISYIIAAILGAAGEATLM